MAQKTSQRRKRHLHHENLCNNGYIYNSHMYSADDMTKFWRCAKRNDGCIARVKIDRDAAYKQMIRGEALAEKRKKICRCRCSNQKTCCRLLTQFLRSTNHRVSSRDSQ